MMLKNSIKSFPVLHGAYLVLLRPELMLRISGGKAVYCTLSAELRLTDFFFIAYAIFSLIMIGKSKYKK